MKLAEVEIQFVADGTYRTILKDSNGTVLDINEAQHDAPMGIFLNNGSSRKGVAVIADWNFKPGKAKNLGAVLKKAIEAHQKEFS